MNYLSYLCALNYEHSICIGLDVFLCIILMYLIKYILTVYKYIYQLYSTSKHSLEKDGTVWHVLRYLFVYVKFYNQVTVEVDS